MHITAYLAPIALKKPMANLFPVKISCLSGSSGVFLFKYSRTPSGFDPPF